MTMPSGYIPPERNLYRSLDTNGDGSGTNNAIGTYAGSAEDFFIQPPAGKVYEINRIITSIQSSTVLASGKYGDQSALTNGIKVYTTIGDEASENLITDIPVKTHDDWASICHDSVALNYGNVAGKSISIRWTFFNSGSPMWLNGDLNHKLIFRLNDDFDGLLFHHFYAQGVIHDS